VVRAELMVKCQFEELTDVAGVDLDLSKETLEIGDDVCPLALF
jgi:hypothetical protein